MKATDLVAVLRGIAPVIQEQIAKTSAEWTARFDAFEYRLEARFLAFKAEPGPQGERGEKGESIVGPVGPTGPKGDQGEPGRDADGAEVQSLKSEVALLKGQLADWKAHEAQTAVDFKSFVAEQVAALVAEWPRPVNGKDGASVTVDDVAPIVAAEVAKAVAVLPVPKDGVGLTGAVLDRDGHLVLTLSDGTAKNVGSVVGRDADMVAVKQHIDLTLASWPRPRDGVDGLGFDDYDEEFEDDGRVEIRRYTSGDRVKEFRHVTAKQIYRGIWAEGREYLRGDTVTWNGSQWHANEKTSAKPGEAALASRAWQLCVKKGNDGKTGPQGAKGDQGDRGVRGNDGLSYRS